MASNPSRSRRKAELFDLLDLDSRKGSDPDEGCWLRPCRFLPDASIGPATVFPVTHAMSHDSREEADAVENREKVGLHGRYKVLARKGKVVDVSGCSSGRLFKDYVGKDRFLNTRFRAFGDNERNATAMVPKEGFPSLAENQTGNMLVEDGSRLTIDHCIDPRRAEDFSLNTEHNNVGIEKESRTPRSAQEGFVGMDETKKENAAAANGCRPIADRCTDNEYMEGYNFNTKYKDVGFEKGSGTSTSAKEAFLELDNGRTWKVEVANRSRILGEQCSKAAHGKVAQGIPKPVVTATRKLPPSVIVSSGEKGFEKSSTNSRFYQPLPEKEISKHDSSGSCSYVTAPCDHVTSQEVISDSTSLGDLHDAIETLSQRRDRRVGKGDILTLAIEKGFVFPLPRWWQPGGYGAEWIDSP